MISYFRFDNHDCWLPFSVIGYFKFKLIDRMSLKSFTVATMTCLTVTEYLSPDFVTRVTRRVPLVVKELPTLPEHLSPSSAFSGVRIARSLVFCAVFCRSLFVPLCLFLWPWCCLSFNLWILIAHLVSSNSS